MACDRNRNEGGHLADELSIMLRKEIEENDFLFLAQPKRDRDIFYLVGLYSLGIRASF